MVIASQSSPTFLFTTRGYQGFALAPYQQYYPPQVQVIQPYQHMVTQPQSVLQEDEDFTQSVQEIVDEQNEEFTALHRLNPFLSHQFMKDNVPSVPSIFG